ncbi:MAG: hypothetical protein Q7S61_03330, partial [bacterium]|nr:hypothetical protein [bacterium]
MAYPKEWIKTSRESGVMEGGFEKIGFKSPNFTIKDDEYKRDISQGALFYIDIRNGAEGFNSVNDEFQMYEDWYFDAKLQKISFAGVDAVRIDDSEELAKEFGNMAKRLRFIKAKKEYELVLVYTFKEKDIWAQYFDKFISQFTLLDYQTYENVLYKIRIPQGWRFDEGQVGNEITLELTNISLGLHGGFRVVNNEKDEYYSAFSTAEQFQHWYSLAPNTQGNPGWKKVKNLEISGTAAILIEQIQEGSDRHQSPDVYRVWLRKDDKNYLFEFFAIDNNIKDSSSDLREKEILTIAESLVFK